MPIWFQVSTFRSTRHENLVLFLGCCMNPPRLGIVMNWCRGATLYKTLHVLGERLDMNRIINIAIHISQVSLAFFTFDASAIKNFSFLGYVLLTR